MNQRRENRWTFVDEVRHRTKTFLGVEQRLGHRFFRGVSAESLRRDVAIRGCAQSPYVLFLWRLPPCKIKTGGEVYMSGFNNIMQTAEHTTNICLIAKTVKSE